MDELIRLFESINRTNPIRIDRGRDFSLYLYIHGFIYIDDWFDYAFNLALDSIAADFHDSIGFFFLRRQSIRRAN